MKLNTRQINLDDNLNWNDLIKESSTATFFQTKEWLQIWCKHFPSKAKIFAIFDGDKIIGIAPLDGTGGKINFLGINPVLGNQMVSDFGDCIAVTGREKEVWESILKESAGQKRELNFLRENSFSFEVLKDLGGRIEEADVAPYIELPGTWDEYLMKLGRHDRHELRRKMRKGENEGITLADFTGQDKEIDIFFQLMADSNEQKRDFLSDDMKSFFKDIINGFREKKMMNLTFLKLKEKTIAGAMTFFFKDEVLLYNSGLDNNFIHLSPGLILTVNLIKKSIETGKKKFDFLRGGERYKYDFGGKERKLYKIIL